MVSLEETLRWAAEEVQDPELPMLTLGDLGMIRGVEVKDGNVRVDLAPTYSGCPATEVIQRDVEVAVRAAGATEVEVRLVRHPPWSTAWITPRGRERLLSAGIAPPEAPAPRKGLALFEDNPVVCPHCGSASTERISAHGSTPCKSLHRCRGCKEPFEHFKCH